MISIAPHVKYTTSDDGAVLLDGLRGRYLSLNRVAATIWEGLRAGRDLGAIRGTLVDRYHVADEVAERDLRAFVGRLESEGLLLISSEEAHGA